MNRLTTEERAKILHLLCEGMSIRSITRSTGASKNTVAKLLIDAGKACAAYHDANARDVKALRVQVHKTWSFIDAKQKNAAAAKAAPDYASDTWTWTAIDTDSRMILLYRVGGSDAEYAKWFLDDLASRLATRVKLTSNGHSAYLEALEGAFGCDVDFAQLVKLYGNVDAPGNCRNSSAECTGIKKCVAEDKPDLAHVSTPYVEGSDPTMRMHRFNHLTKPFSKKVESHAHAVALHTMYYNFVRIHKTLQVTPAMEAGVADRLWDIADVAELVEQAEAKQGKRGPSK